MLVGVKTIPTAFPGGGDHNARYLDQVMRAIRTVQTDTRFVIFTTPENHDAYEGWMRVPVQGGGSSLMGMLGRGDGLDGPIKQAKIDLLMSPMVDPYLGRSVPQALYGLDIAPWERGGEPDAEWGHAPIKVVRRASQQARSIIVPSEYLRRRCLELFGTPLNKCVVVGTGVSQGLKVEERSIVEPPYLCLLVDGLAAPVLDKVHKVIELFEKEYEHTIVLLGPARTGQPDVWSDRVVRIEQCPDSQLAGLYQHASLFWYPGLYDGSGLRVIEALTAGVPVVCARSGAIHEMVGDTPVYYNAENADSMLQALRRVVESDKEFRRTRINFGRQAVTRYDWNDVAWKFLSAFKRVDG
ncbi:MAG: glycosyltransferase [Candidatus Hydrogenedens sp.]|nr:glycosyltransferase [Candidatus Hydrogenedens sp.]